MTAVLTFAMGGASFGLPVGDVDEIVRAATPSPLPGSPAIVTGVLNVRGTVVPVIDVRGRAGFDSRELRASDRFILARAGAERLAFAVDATFDVVEVEGETVVRAEDGYQRSPLIAGIARLASGVLVIYDLDQFLSSAERSELRAALASLEGAARS